MNNSFYFFFKKECLGEIELKHIKDISSEEKIRNLRLQFYRQLEHVLAEYSRRWFRSISPASANMLSLMVQCLQQEVFDAGYAIALITQFMAKKNWLFSGGRLYEALLPIWGQAMRLLCLDQASFNRFIELSDFAHASLLQCCVHTQLSENGEDLTEVSVGEHLLTLAMQENQEYICTYLINRGFYPTSSQYLPDRFVDIGSTDFSNSNSSILYQCYDSLQRMPSYNVSTI